ncbi:hypothetical protein ACRALDRAFT_1066310 [Sodiomyces alcalophilus JCM 7366]|uniref:uncharacterized protein n=1 Tax=Sodiomyces alcalophilus JCM 7366 TaxID=591952 RepID=UPI0039B4377D
MPQYRGGRYRGGRRLATGGIVGIAIAGLVVLLFAFFCLYCCCFRKRRAKRKGIPHQPPRRRSGLSGMLGRIMPGRKPRRQQYYADMEQNQQTGYAQQPHQGYNPGYGNPVGGVGGHSYGPGYQTGGHSYDYGRDQDAGVTAPPPAYK